MWVTAHSHAAIIAAVVAVSVSPEEIFTAYSLAPGATPPI